MDITKQELNKEILGGNMTDNQEDIKGTSMTKAQTLAAVGIQCLTNAVMLVITESTEPISLEELLQKRLGLLRGSDDTVTTGILEMLWYFRAVDLQGDSEGINRYTAIKSIDEVSQEFKTDFNINDLEVD